MAPLAFSPAPSAQANLPVTAFPVPASPGLTIGQPDSATIQASNKLPMVEPVPVGPRTEEWPPLALSPVSAPPAAVRKMLCLPCARDRLALFSSEL